jgi:hypothetical protein
VKFVAERAKYPVGDKIITGGTHNDIVKNPVDENEKTHSGYHDGQK